MQPAGAPDAAQVARGRHERHEAHAAERRAAAASYCDATGNLSPPLPLVLPTPSWQHWVAYSVENYDNVTRHTYNAEVSAYDLSDTYFPGWERTIKHGGAMGVMCSYNELNGVPTCGNPNLTSILRDQWGFKGAHCPIFPADMFFLLTYPVSFLIFACVCVCVCVYVCVHVCACLSLSVFSFSLWLPTATLPGCFGGLLAMQVT